VPVFIGGTTAVRRASDITAAGAVALGSEIEDGLRLILSAVSGGRR
jgi:hypothetical protein